ncbi:MAG: polyamine aminopropyltransferase [Nitrososphaerota archaeon]|nr:polyamine aminopropyltransferase [Aigarchaeota archaeon]MDW8077025.1 polyamine aminopropyltransferase [Nitrososphaerota archaeon]
MGEVGGVNWRLLLEWQTPTSAVLHLIKRIIYSGRTKYQEVDIVDTYDFGLCLVLDGKLQSSSADEKIYHESLVHPAMLTHPKPSRVLIIGGGEGATLREVLKHRTIEKAVMVDIDEEVIQLCKRYLPEFHMNSFDDPRAEIVIEDGRKYVERLPDGSFDVAILDVTDPLEGGPSYLLYTIEFYRMLARKLSDYGVFATQATSTYHSRNCFTAIYKTVASVFPVARAYRAFVPSYASEWGFVLGSKAADPLSLTPEEIGRRLKERGAVHLEFYSPDIHHGLFTLPPYLARALETARPITDSSPVFMPA